MTSFAFARQLIESKATSLNQVAATFKKIAFASGSLNLDYGGGRFDKGTEALAAQGARNVVYDPFNRTEEHNLLARLSVARAGGAHTATVNNVLNVIAEPEALSQAIEQAASGLRADGKAYFLIHEGDRTGIGRATSKGWQRNQKAADYEAAIKASFGSASRKGNIVTASGPRPGSASLFDLRALGAETLARAKALGVPMPSARHGVGKLIGGCLYLHKSCWDALPQAELGAALARVPEGLSPDIAKWEPKTGCFSFIACSGFDCEHEPAIQGSAKVSPYGSVSLSREKADPQIYHHKWNFVRPDYAGFDYLASVARSIAWAQAPCDRSRIGTRSFWERTVAWPHLNGVGASGADPRAPKPAPASRKARARA